MAKSYAWVLLTVACFVVVGTGCAASSGRSSLRDLGQRLMTSLERDEVDKYRECWLDAEAVARRWEECAAADGSEAIAVDNSEGWLQAARSYLSERDVVVRASYAQLRAIVRERGPAELVSVETSPAVASLGTRRDVSLIEFSFEFRNGERLDLLIDDAWLVDEAWLLFDKPWRADLRDPSGSVQELTWGRKQ
ncbi:MAG: hypothetical protein AAF581_09725 [Planctomycetota bacterium]